MPFRFLIDGIDKKISRDQGKKIIELFDPLPFQFEHADLNNYKTVFLIIENGNDGHKFFGERVTACRHNDLTDESFHLKYSLK